MQTITRTYDIYKFDELTEEAKGKALDSFRTSKVEDFEWWDVVYEDAEEIGRLMGIDISNIWFSGFWSQGDGACFEGDYAYAKGSVKAARAHAPLDMELQRIALELSRIQRRYFYQIHANVKHRGHYYNELCTDIGVYKTGDGYSSSLGGDVQAEVRGLLRDFMRWIYKQLEKEHDYLTSDKAVREMIEANEYEFNADGSQFY